MNYLLNYLHMIIKLVGLTLFPGIYLLPFVFYESGIVMALIFGIIYILLVVSVSTMQIEAIAIQNSLKNEGHDALNTLKEGLNDFNDDEKQNKDESDEDHVVDVIKISSYSNINVKEDQDNFYINKKFEIGELLEKTISKKIHKVFIKILLMSFFILSISITLNISGRTIYHYINEKDYVTIDLPFFIYSLIILALSAISVSISLCKVAFIFKILNYLVYLRLIYLFGEFIYLIILSKQAQFEPSLIKIFDASNFNTLLGVCTYMFSCFHLLPSLVENFSPQKRFYRILTIALLISFIIGFFQSFMGIISFSNVLTCDLYFFPSSINFNFALNLVNVKVLGEFLCIFQILNCFNIAYNLNRLKQIDFFFFPTTINKFGSSEKKSGKKYEILKEFFISLLLITPSILITNFVKLEYLINYAMTIIGYFLISYVFLILANNAKNKLLNYDIPKGKMHLSIKSSKFISFLYYLGVLVILVFSVISLFQMNNKDCINKF